MVANRKTIYLCGAIEGLTQEEATGWRNTAKEVLKDKYDVIDPMDGKDVSKEYDPVWIVQTDMRNVSNSNILLVEMTHENKACIGTAMEIREAYCWDIKIYVWGTANWNSYFLRYHTDMFFDTLGQAIEYLKECGK